MIEFLLAALLLVCISIKNYTVAIAVMIPGLTIGTLLGVVFCKGIPVGPLIAAGMTGMLARGLGILRLLILIPLFLQTGVASAQAEDCELDWPQSCGALKPDPPGSFPSDEVPGTVSKEENPVLLTLIDPNETPEILCRSETLGDVESVKSFIQTRFKSYLGPKSLRTYNMHAAIVRTVLKVKYKSGRIVSFGESQDYFCINDKADRILYGYASR